MKSVQNFEMHGGAILFGLSLFITNYRLFSMVFILAITSVFLSNTSFSQCVHDNSVIQITTNTTWSTFQQIPGDVLVTDGNTLTVTGPIQFWPTGKLIVEPNAVLIVDGGILTTNLDCVDYWDGVIVLGDNTKVQTPVSSYRFQGLVEIKNGGTISHAIIGVSLWDRSNSATAGGVIISNNGNLINNRIGIEFNRYPAPGSGITANNISFIKASVFLTDNNLLPFTGPTTVGINVRGIRGLRIFGCEFEDTQYSGSLISGPRGIQSFLSSIRVDGYCTNPLSVPCPSNQFVPSTFTNLYYGVLAWFNDDKNVRVDRCEFVDCSESILLWQLENPLALRNDIQMRYSTFFDTLIPLLKVGIGLSYSDGFRVEENLLQANTRSVGQIGIEVEEALTEENVIYKNYVNDFEEARYTGGLRTGATRSWGVNSHNTMIQGLQWLCNEYRENKLDLMITPEGFQGIRLVQGVPGLGSQSAGNIFIHTSAYEYDIYNDNTINFPIDYYHHGGSSYPSIVYGADRYLASEAKECVSKIKDIDMEDPGDPGSPGLTGGEIDEYEDQLFQILPEYEATKNYIYDRIDEGRTAYYVNMLDEISNEDNAINVYNEITIISPFVSKEILSKAVRISYFTEEHLMELLTSNPDATKSEAFITYLREQSTFDFDEQHENQIRESWQQITELTELLHYCSGLSFWASELTTMLLNEYKRTDIHDISKIFNLYNLWPSLRYKYAYSEILTNNGEYSAAYEYLDAIPERFTLSCEEVFEHYNYINLLRLEEIINNEIDILQNLIMAS